MSESDVTNYILEMLWNSSTAIKDDTNGSTTSVSNMRTRSQNEKLTLIRREDQNMTVYSPTKESNLLTELILKNL